MLQLNKKFLSFSYGGIMKSDLICNRQESMWFLCDFLDQALKCPKTFPNFIEDLSIVLFFFQLEIMTSTVVSLVA